MPWPRQLVASGVLVWDERGRLLVVRTHSRSAMILPGGLVEEGESPAAAGQREVQEEVGLDVTIGRLLVVQHLAATPERPSSMQLVFDSEVVAGPPPLCLQAEEIAEAHWVDPTTAVALHAVRSRPRLDAALAAHAGGPVLFIDAARTP